MREYEEKILEPSLLEMFCKSFISKLEQYKLSYYIREKDSNISKENVIHSAILWTRQAVKDINNSRTIKGSKEISDLFILISYIDILLESTEQIYRVLYNTNKYPKFDDEEFCFREAPDEYSDLANREYFKEIRAIFTAHPQNIKARGKYKRFSDIPIYKCKVNQLSGRNGDFNVRLWSNTRNDEDTIHFPLYIDDLINYVRIIYMRYEIYIKRLGDIAGRKIK